MSATSAEDRPSGRRAQLRAVVLGDIGRVDNYHLGDEAMTEVAIEQLTARGVRDITLAAVDPATAQAFYGVPAVRQFGFAWNWSRQKVEAALTGLTEALRDGTATGPLVEAVRAADLVVIAGGGNLTSEYPLHVYERVAFSRIAAHFGVPLFVTSQTVGPVLRARERDLVTEIIDAAVCFGARERFSTELVRELAADPERVRLTLDDGVLLRADESARTDATELNLGERIIVASFAADQGATGWSREEYAPKVARLLDELAEALDARVVLAPHTGGLEPAAASRDHQLGLDIAAAGSGAITALPVLPAREYLAILEAAMLSISTRYHPTVFAPALGVPTVGIAMSQYSSVRMRGALGNVGLERFVVPAAAWDQLVPASLDAVANGAPAAEQARSAAGYQARWWDAIVDAAERGRWTGPDEYRPPEPIDVDAAWSVLSERIAPLFDTLTAERVVAKLQLEEAAAALATAESRAREERLRADGLERRLAELGAERDGLRGQLAAARDRRIVKVADTVGEIARRVRGRG
ncbi:polysaccharide pyruvyl transferase family protein [Agromyces mediolanus]|uniref:polysaccharide pyruvyl transferase family protein n=1 Tax=Agromyces mediolanus TaxID=41986 RepID=UPI00203A65FB|nr:polysaccharide pyruvyl transferase family protein [Agromyces mediolanus]MCM3656547.1 polysaccharide pyruvyl transferase family protein [Agromyces mediolanus]